MHCGHWVTVLIISFFATMTEGIPIDNSVQNTIEIRVFVDRQAFNSWKNKLTPAEDPDFKRNLDTKVHMTMYIKSVFIGVNAILKELNSHGINLDARIVSIEFITSETISANIYDGNKVSSDKVLTSFYDWLATKSYPTSDHNLLLTGWDLSNGEQTHVLGVSYMGQMCHNTKSLSAVEVQRNGNTVLTLAHELGHSLNASHDGEGNICPLNSEMIMDFGRSQNSTNNFKYSWCSRYSIKNFLELSYESISGSCLSATNTNTAEVQGTHLGQLYDPDTICRMSVGPHSYFGRTFYEAGRALDYSRICTAIWCLKKASDASGASTYTAVEGTDGFPCGSGKECSLGFCLESQNASTAVSDTCPFGDAPSYAIVYNNNTCDELITRADTSSCYRLFTKRICCASCQDAATGVQGCEYGDKASWCSAMPARSCYRDSYREVCCTGVRCKQVEISIPGCKYGDREGWCADLTARQCYTNNVTCCQKCKEFETSIPSCKYGDKAPWCAALTPISCYSNNVTCCKKCKELETSIPGCKYGDKAPWCAALTPISCYSNNVMCCKKCKELETSIPGCKYGDKAPWCAALTPISCYSNNVTCCKKCKELETSIPGCEYGDRASWCANLTARRCYSNNVTCCKICKEFETNIPECRYGDQDDTCPSYITENKDRCQISNNRKVCCKSCANYGTAGTNTGTGTSSSTTSGTSAGTSSSGSGTASGTNAGTASFGTGSGSGSETGTAAGNSAGTASSGSASAAGTNTGTASSGTGSGSGPGTASSGSESSSGSSSGTSSAGSGSALGNGTDANAGSNFTGVTTGTADLPSIRCEDHENWCSQMILETARNHYLCYWINEICCTSCKQVEYEYLGIPGCKYGDRMRSCRSSRCHKFVDTTLCCATCHE